MARLTSNVVHPDGAPPDFVGRVARATWGREITFEVLGVPSPKGSFRVITRKPDRTPRDRPLVLKDSPKTITWHKAVADACWAYLGTLSACPIFTKQALVFEMVAFLPRPPSHLTDRGTLRKSAPALPQVKPDFDKLLRSSADPLQGLVFDEDSRIVDGHIFKRYATQRPGAVLRVALYRPNLELRGAARGLWVG